jgi:hypothetical protein
LLSVAGCMIISLIFPFINPCVCSYV